MKNLIVSCFVLVFALTLGITAATAQTTPASTNPNPSLGAFVRG